MGQSPIFPHFPPLAATIGTRTAQVNVKRENFSCEYRHLPSGRTVGFRPPRRPKINALQTTVCAFTQECPGPGRAGLRRGVSHHPDRIRPRLGGSYCFLEPGSVPNAGRQRVKIGSRPISRVLSWTIIPLGRTSPCASSDLPGNTRGPRAAASSCLLPYLVLLRAGFAVPFLLPGPRCALTAPFHPYRPAGLRRPTLAVCFLLHFPWALAPQALPGALPCGARTFLTRHHPHPCQVVCRARLPSRLPQSP